MFCTTYVFFCFFFSHSTKRPCLIVNDLELVKKIFIKDFEHFTDRATFSMDTSKGANMYTSNFTNVLGGKKWKVVRNALSASFTSAKLKGMVPLIDKESQNWPDQT